MKIANPIYDIAFKYLMEDEEIARGLLSIIIGEEIVELQMLPQEFAYESQEADLRIVRFDFKAEIRTKDKGRKKILIELQKAKRFFDIMRFRTYLGENYRTPDIKRHEKDEKPKLPLPIITIYFLGFELDGINAPVVQILRQYYDVAKGEKIEQKTDFIELLTHDSFVIQIPLLRKEMQTALLEVLQIFSPDYATDDRQVFDFSGKSENPILKKMIKRLSRAVSEEDVRRQMDFEDEIERVFQRELEKEMAEANRRLDEERKRAEAAEQEVRKERQKAEQERQKAEQEHQKAEQERQKAEHERQKAEQARQKAQAAEQQIREQANAFAKEMLALGLDIVWISGKTGLSVEEIEALKGE